jgi:60 kDa SS-A/Ro ribonucleoprotein
MSAVYAPFPNRNGDPKLFRKVFRKVIDNGKMLRNVIQMARSGAVTGKKHNMSAGAYRHAIRDWFNEKSPWALFKASIGNDPSMRDILRMARPRPNTPEKAALFGYFLNKKVEFEALPEVVQKYEKWKATKEGPVPDVDFRMLDSLGLQDKDWIEIARNAPWMMTRMNLNTFARHGVFKDREVTKLVAERLRDKEQIEKARAFPYQLFVAWREVGHNADVPSDVKEALQDAMEIAIGNVPAIKGDVHVCCDTSGSMGSAITGSGGGRHTSSVTCVEVAGLISSAVVRNNRAATVWTFNNDAVKVNLNPRDTVITNTQKLAKAGGGTNVSAPLRKMNEQNVKADVVIYVSDYESWIDSGSSYSYYGTGLADEWQKFKARNPKARLVCCDLTPRSNSQIKTRPDVLQVGGFSDSVFDVVASFVEHGFETDHWVEQIEKTVLD